jgi:hypothetical protein
MLLPSLSSSGAVQDRCAVPSALVSTPGSTTIVSGSAQPTSSSANTTSGFWLPSGMSAVFADSVGEDQTQPPLSTASRRPQ